VKDLIPYSLMVFVNGEAMGFDHVLQDGDIIDIYIPAGGG